MNDTINETASATPSAETYSVNFTQFSHDPAIGPRFDSPKPAYIILTAQQLRTLAREATKRDKAAKAAGRERGALILINAPLHLFGKYADRIQIGSSEFTDPANMTTI